MWHTSHGRDNVNLYLKAIFIIVLQLLSLQRYERHQLQMVLEPFTTLNEKQSEIHVVLKEMNVVYMLLLLQDTCVSFISVEAITITPSIASPCETDGVLWATPVVFG